MRKIFMRYSGKRATIMGLNVTLATGLFIFIMIIVNLIIGQYFFRIDLSSSKKYTLSKESRKIVKELSKDIDVFVFTREKSTSSSRAEELLETYRYLNRRISYSIIDPDKSPSLAEKYRVAKYDTLVISTKDDKFVKAEGIGEAEITNSIVKLTRGAVKKIYFVEGHGENQINDKERSGYSMLREGLEAIGYPVKSLLLLGAEKIPDDAGLIVVGGPRTPFKENEIKILTDYFKSGGSLIILNESIVVSGMDRMLKEAGVSMLPDFLWDPTAYLSGSELTTLLIKDYPRTAVTENLRLPTVFPTASALSIFAAMKSLYEYADVVATSKNASIGKSKEAGVFKVGISVIGRKGEGQMIIFGDSDFVTNLYYQFPGNSALFRNIADYMMGAKGLVTVAQQENFVPMYLSKGQSGAIYYTSLFIAPSLILIAGAFMWLRRRGL